MASWTSIHSSVFSCLKISKIEIFKKVYHILYFFPNKMSQVGSYGFYTTYCNPIQRYLILGIAGCKVVEDKGEFLVVQPMIQGSSGHLTVTVGSPREIFVTDFVKSTSLVPLV